MRTYGLSSDKLEGRHPWPTAILVTAGLGIGAVGGFVASLLQERRNQAPQRQSPEVPPRRAGGVSPRIAAEPDKAETVISEHIPAPRAHRSGPDGQPRSNGMRS